MCWLLESALLTFWVLHVLLSCQRLMRDLEEKEKELNKLKMKADGLLNNNHPASDKIQVRCSFFLFIMNSKLFSSFVLITV